MALFWSLGAPRAILDVIFLSFFDFWSALGAQEAPKGGPRSAKATKKVPKVVQKGAKSDLERLFFLKLAKP